MAKSTICVKKNVGIGFILISLFMVSTHGSEEKCGNEICVKTVIKYDCSGTTMSQFKCPDNCVANVSNIDLSRNLFQKLLNEDSCFGDIQVFNASHNVLQEFDTFISAREGDISYNNLRGTLSLDQYYFLEKLYASNNSLEKIYCGGAHKLNFLDVTGNKIKNIEDCSSLQDLRAASNRLEITCVTKLENLQYLDISNNSLHEISKLPENVKTLIVSHNNIKSLEVDAFRNLGDLKILDLSWNYLEVFPSLQLGPNIVEIDLSNNNIHDMNIQVIENLININENNGTVDTTVDLRNNKFSKNSEGVREIVYNPEYITNSTECSCVNVTVSSFLIMFCVNDAKEEQPCWWVEEPITTTTTTARASTTIPSQVDQSNATNEHKQNMISPEEKNETQPSNRSETLSHAAYFVESFGAAKLSFLGFLLVTLIALVIINCIVGDPIVDDYWWEDKQPSDRPVT